MTEQEQTINNEVVDNSTNIEPTQTPIEDINAVARETINNEDKEELTPDESNEEVTVENVPLPEEKKELTKEDHILKRKEKQIEREKRRLIEEKHAEVERLKQENEEIRKRALVTEVNSYRAPIREDFETDEDFFDARLRYNFAKETAERIQQAEHEQSENRKEVLRAKVSNAQNIGEDKYHDFEEVTRELGRDGILTNKPLVEAILDSDYSADVFYLLGKYPSIREKLNGMDPIKSIKELAKLEQRFEQQLKAKKVATPEKKIIEPLSHKAGNAVKKRLEEYTEAELNALPDKEFRRIMKEQSRNSTY